MAVRAGYFCAMNLSYGWLCGDSSSLFIYFRKKGILPQPGIVITEVVLRLKNTGQARWLKVKTTATRLEDVSSITGSHTVERTPPSCPLTSICALWHICIHIHGTNKQMLFIYLFYIIGEYNHSSSVKAEVRVLHLRPSSTTEPHSSFQHLNKKYC